MSICGGFTQEDVESGVEEQTMLEALKADIEAKLGTTFAALRAKSHRTQVVAGTNYLINVVEEGGNAKLLVKIGKPLPHTGKAPFLMDVQKVE